MNIPQILPRKSEGLRLYEEFVGNLAFFLDYDTGEPFLSFPFANGHQILPLLDPAVWNLVVNRWADAGHAVPSRVSVRFALRALEARCRRSLDRRVVSHRISGYGERLGPAIPKPTQIVIDLLSKKGDVLRIDPDYWTVSEGATHGFTRGAHMRPLPEPPQEIFFTADYNKPAPGTLAPELEQLRPLLNPASDKDFHRSLLWLVTSMRGPAPGELPVLAIEAGPGSGKSTAARVLRHILDPVAASFTPATLNSKQLIEHARRNYLLAFDNIGRLSPRLAQFINSISSGMTVEVRAPRDPHPPAAVELRHPVLLTLQPPPAPVNKKPAQDPLASAGPSLPERTLRVRCAPLTPESRKPLTKIWTQFGELLPQLFTLLCTALSVGLKNYPNVKLSRIPRLPDTAAWALAVAPALGLTEEQVLEALELDPPDRPPVVDAITEHMQDRETWEGTATQLQDEIETNAGNPRALAHQLREHAEELAAEGIEVTFPRSTKSRRIVITKIPDFASPPRPAVLKAAAATASTSPPISQISEDLRHQSGNTLSSSAKRP